MQLQKGIIHWNVLFMCPAHDWEGDVVSRFFELYSQKVRYEGEYTICLVPSKGRHLK
jgi:hypothetical protein